MSKSSRLNERKCYCISCGHFIDSLTLKTSRDVIRCKNCKTQFRFNNVSDWLEDDGGVKGVVIDVSLSAKVDNSVVRKMLKGDNEGTDGSSSVSII